MVTADVDMSELGGATIYAANQRLSTLDSRSVNLCIHRPRRKPQALPEAARTGTGHRRATCAVRAGGPDQGAYGCQSSAVQ